MDYTVWINKKTYVIELSKYNIEMGYETNNSISPASTNMVISTDVRLYDFGKSVDFDIPSQALEAKDVTDMLDV